MFKQIDFWARRVVAWPLVAFGWLLTSIAGELILIGAWLMDREDVLDELGREK